MTTKGSHFVHTKFCEARIFKTYRIVNKIEKINDVEYK